MKKKVQRWCERTVNNKRLLSFFKCAIVDAHRQEAERRADLWAAREWFEQIGLCLPAPPLPQPVFSFPLQRASGGDRTVWKPHSQHAHTNRPPPHPLPASLACSQVVGIPTACSAMIWLMEFDFQRGSLKRVWLFGRARDETGGRRGSWEGRDAWRAEAESCQLDFGGTVSL